MFGGKMKEHQARGERDLAEFRGSEMVPEEGLLAAANQAMRERVSDRLYRESGDFKAHRDRMDRLAETLESKVKPVADIARSIDKDLQDMAEARRLEAYYLLMASQHENDPVYNDKGEVTGYEDNSGMWKTMAATQASQAQSKAAGANAGLRAMKALLTPLYKDPVLKAEGLVFALPNGADQRVSEGHGIFWDIFMPSLFSFFSNMGSQSQANEARAKFSPVLASLQSVESELNSRRAAEASSVNGAVTADLDRQMRQVPAER